MRAGGSGIAAFYTRTGVGTQVQTGGLPQRHDAEGNVVKGSEPKPTQVFEVDGEKHEFVLEESIRADFSLVHAAKADRYGNLVFNKAARNFNPLAAMSGKVCIAQVEELVDAGDIEPDDVHLPGVFVHRVVVVGKDIEKRIERRTVREEQ